MGALPRRWLKPLRSEMLTTQEFDRARRLALKLAGIDLFERHREVLARRSRRLGLEGRAFETLLNAVERGESTAIQQFLCLVTTKFTGFFRHPEHFETAAEHALNAVQQRGRACLWSAAVASGEEPYSLAMALIEKFQTEEPPVEILATDVDAGALSVAQHGEYGELSLRALTPTRRERFFVESEPGRRWSVTSPLRRLVRFETLNLIGSSWPVAGPFDVILCRNVLMYLQPRHREPVLERVASLLTLDGLLMLDPAEYPGRAERLFTRQSEGVYSRRPAAHSSPVECQSSRSQITDLI